MELKQEWKPLKKILEENKLPVAVRRKSLLAVTYTIVGYNNIGCVGYDNADIPVGIKFNDTDYFGKVDNKDWKEKIFNSCLRKSAFSKRPLGHENKYNQTSYKCNICGKWHLTKVGAMR